jgi:hypothetical protein
MLVRIVGPVATACGAGTCRAETKAKPFRFDIHRPAPHQKQNSLQAQRDAWCGLAAEASTVSAHDRFEHPGDALARHRFGYIRAGH